METEEEARRLFFIRITEWSSQRIGQILESGVLWKGCELLTSYLLQLVL